jgi:hypothetical protein
MKGISYCGACADYDIKKHRCKRGAKLESNPQDKFFDDCPLPDAVPVVRCKDCEYSYDEISYLCCSHGVCVDCEVPPNFYCAEGKRKENDE